MEKPREFGSGVCRICDSTFKKTNGRHYYCCCRCTKVGSRMSYEARMREIFNQKPIEVGELEEYKKDLITRYTP